MNAKPNWSSYRKDTEPIKAMFHKICLEMLIHLIAIVLSVLPNVFIVSYGIAKCIREITRGNVICRYLMTNELI